MLGVTVEVPCEIIAGLWDGAIWLDVPVDTTEAETLRLFATVRPRSAASSLLRATRLEGSVSSTGTTDAARRLVRESRAGGRGLGDLEVSSSEATFPKEKGRILPKSFAWS